MTEMNSMVELLIRTKPNAPGYFAGLLTSTYYDEYHNPYDLEESAKRLIVEFYGLHYGGKQIESSVIEKIVHNFHNNLPLLIMCIYLQDIVGDDNMVELCILNQSIVYKIIYDVYSGICPPNEIKEFHFSNSTENLVLDSI